MNHCALAREHASDPNWSPAQRLACEAAYLLRLPLVRRRDELAKPARSLRREALESEMRRQMDLLGEAA